MAAYREKVNKDEDAPNGARGQADKHTLDGDLFGGQQYSSLDQTGL